MKSQNIKFSLKHLAYNYLKLKIHQGIHDSIEDAKITLSLSKIGAEILPFIKKEIEESFDDLNRFCQINKVYVVDEPKYYN